ncbi:MAG: SBBP repeat-containing protein [Bacteroidia bacterium]
MKRFIILIVIFSASCASAQSCLDFVTYFGQVNQDEIKGVCVDQQHNSYVVGNTYNTNLPVTPGCFQSVNKGNYEIFMAKFDSCGYLVWCTYFGGMGNDTGEKLVYSAADNTILLCAHTNGPDIPVTSGCFQPLKAGSEDCVLAKFTTAGNPLWITYFGGTGGDYAYDAKVDALGNIVIGGTTISNTLYTTSTSFQQTLSGATDAFIARFNKNGNLTFSTYYGGTNSEDIHALAIDKNCNIIGIGGTFSTNMSTSAGCYQPYSNGGMEVYVIKLDSSGQRIFSTYIGDTGTDDAFGACTDQQNNIYLSGHTNSLNFYTSTGAYQTVNAGNNDIWCLKLNAGGQMQWSTYIGGSMNDFCSRMAINNLNELTLLASTYSPDFPMLGASTYTSLSGTTDMVLVKFMSNGTPFWSTYMGGSADEVPNDLVSVYPNKVVFAGAVTSSNFPLTGYNYQNTFNGTEDGLLVWLSTPVNPLSGVESVPELCHAELFSNTEANLLEVRNNSCSVQGDYYIYNSLGCLVCTGRFRSPEISVSSLNAGVYLLKLKLDNADEKELKFVKN